MKPKAGNVGGKGFEDGGRCVAAFVRGGIPTPKARKVPHHHMPVYVGHEVRKGISLIGLIHIAYTCVKIAPSSIWTITHCLMNRGSASVCKIAASHSWYSTKHTK